jgi:hypothetical protein
MSHLGSGRVTSGGFCIDNTPGFQLSFDRWPPPPSFFVSLWSKNSRPDPEILYQHLISPKASDNDPSRHIHIDFGLVEDMAQPDGTSPAWEGRLAAISGDVAVILTTHWRYDDHAVPAALVSTRRVDDEGRCFADFVCAVKFYLNVEGKSCLEGEGGFISVLREHFRTESGSARLAFAVGNAAVTKWCIS